MRKLIQDTAAAKSANGSLEQKVGDYYASFIDEANIESKGLAPLSEEMVKIAKIGNKVSLSAYLGTRYGASCRLFAPFVENSVKSIRSKSNSPSATFLSRSRTQRHYVCFELRRRRWVTS